MFFFIVNRRRFSKCPRPLWPAVRPRKGRRLSCRTSERFAPSPPVFDRQRALPSVPLSFSAQGLGSRVYFDLADVTDVVSPVVSFPKVWGEWR